jgi:hypothetical protein
MQRFKQYIGKDFVPEHVKESEALRSAGFACDSLPDRMGDFEECEFVSDFNGQTLFLCVAVLAGKVKRIMFVVAGREDPDEVRPLSEAELKSLLDQRGGPLVNFFEYVTR